MTFESRKPFFSLRSFAFNSESKAQVSERFQDRVSLFGPTSGGDCSLRMERVQKNDARAFSISLKRREDSQWGSARKFTLEVLGESAGWMIHTQR